MSKKFKTLGDSQTEDKNEIAIITKENIEDKIYFIRGQKVMLDFDLAEIYGYSTKAFNQQVKRNIEKFEGGDFMFCLEDNDIYSVRSQNVTSPESKLFQGQEGGTRYYPYAFTEQGIYMLMTVLRGELAIKQSRALVRIFKQMKDFLVENQNIISDKDLIKLSLQVSENTREISNIKDKIATKKDIEDINISLTELMKKFIDPSNYKHTLIMNGQPFKAEVVYRNIYSLAEKTIYIIDNYINLKTLDLLRGVSPTVKIIIFSDNIGKNDRITLSMLKDFKTECPNIDIDFKITDGKYHDRFIVIDYKTNNELIYYCGSSSKDAGNRITTISQIDYIEIYRPLLETLLKNPRLDIKK